MVPVGPGNLERVGGGTGLSPGRGLARFGVRRTGGWPGMVLCPCRGPFRLRLTVSVRALLPIATAAPRWSDTDGTEAWWCCWRGLSQCWAPHRDVYAGSTAITVSYTHLTLPTNREV